MDKYLKDYMNSISHRTQGIIWRIQYWVSLHAPIDLTADKQKKYCKTLTFISLLICPRLLESL